MRWRLCVAGGVALLALAGCGRWFAEREPWRREAEVACLKAGAVREGPAVAQLGAINGPGICGADFPLKVTALGESPALGYSAPARPPGAIPGVLSRGSPAVSTAPYGGDPGARAFPPASKADDDAFESDDAPPGQPGAWEGRLPRLGGPPAVRSAPQPRVPPMSHAVGPVGIVPPATLACPIVSALDQWLATGVQPAALRWLGQPVAEVKQISAYSCRGMNGQPGARISEHAFGNALDISAFVLADGRTVTVREGWRGLPEEQGFLRDVHAAACTHFATALAPGSNMFHYDHLHVDLMRRGSGRSVCNPEPVSGESVAARAGGARRGPSIQGMPRSEITGSTHRRGRAVAGED